MSMPLLLLCFLTFVQQTLANPPQTDQATTVTDASLDHPRILSIVKVGQRIILKDDNNSTSCFQIEPLSLLWTKFDNPNSKDTPYERLPAWRIDEVLAQSALNQGIDQATLMALNQGIDQATILVRYLFMVQGHHSGEPGVDLRRTL
jgi:hypothetical protein